MEIRRPNDAPPAVLLARISQLRLQRFPGRHFLGRALQGLYPESETFRESMQLLIQAYNKSTLGHGNGRSEEEDDSGSDVDKDLHHDPSNTDTTLTKKTDQCAERKEPSKPLACPFFQRNPEKFQKRRSCAGPGYMNTHRLKYVSSNTLMTLILRPYQRTSVSKSCATADVQTVLQSVQRLCRVR